MDTPSFPPLRLPLLPQVLQAAAERRRGVQAAGHAVGLARAVLHAALDAPRGGAQRGAGAGGRAGRAGAEAYGTRTAHAAHPYTPLFYPAPLLV